MRIEGKYIINTVEELAMIGCIAVEGNGLIIGKKHSEGGIKFYLPYDSSGSEFILSGEMEGGEYVTGLSSMHTHMDQLEAINSYQIDSGYITEEEFKSIKELPIYDLSKTNKVLVFAHKPICIINHCATKKYIKELVALDKASENL